MHRQILISVVLTIAIGCTRQKAPDTTTETTGAATSIPAASYTPRIGVGVSTNSRTCLAIQNTTLQADSPVTLILPATPQTFMQGEITGPAHDPCPVSKELDPALTSYDVRIGQGQVQKLTPLIGVVGTSAPFSMMNNAVQADLDQNGKFQMFRACSANDGVHLTAWRGQPLSGTLIWHGYYYEPANPGTGPACTPKEVVAP